MKIGPEKTAATFRLPNARNVRALVLQWSRELPRDVVADLKLR